jgi:hypothetical protein
MVDRWHDPGGRASAFKAQVMRAKPTTGQVVAESAGDASEADDRSGRGGKRR